MDTTSCVYCDRPNMTERVELGISYCKACAWRGIQDSNRIVLVCGHKSGYQPMFVEDVASMAHNPKRS